MWLATPARRRYRIALDLGDPDLRDALAEALEGHPALAPAEPGAAPDLVIADHPAAVDGAKVLRIGAGPLSGDAGPELILSAAHVLAAGLRLEPAGAAPDPGPASPRLSLRERQVLALLVDGAPNKAIARALGISARTAKFHVAAVLAKLGARNRSEAVARALREGLVVL